MVRHLIVGTLTVLFALTAGGCGSPFLHSAATVPSQDDGLVGEWAAVEPMQIRAMIAPPKDGSSGSAYAVSLTVHEKGEFKTAVSVDLTLTDIGRARFADLFLSRPERDKLVGTYGFLVVPVHQTMKVMREGDRLTFWPFRADWLEKHAAGDVFSHDRVAIGGGDVSMVTAPAERIRELLGEHGDDAQAFSDPIVFRRVTPGQ